MLSTLLGLACASQGVISGGPEDKTPPKVVAEKSTPNYQTHFKEQQIELNFDEFVTINNPLKELVISPPLTYLPKVDGRGKTVRFTFNEDEVLKEDATYSINFGQSIKDFRASNPLENYTFVFSTGDYIDSLSIAGSVVNAKDEKEMADVLVMLYTDLRDSVPYLEKPFYSTRTDKEGKFQINNIKADTFKLFALKDENVNYLYDLDEEFIAYIDTALIITDSSKFDQLKLFAFQEDPAVRIINVDSKQKGLVKILLNQNLDELEYEHTYPSTFIQEFNQDTLLLFYDTTNLVNNDTLFVMQDTFVMKKARSTSTTPSFSVRNININDGESLSPLDSIAITLSTPVTSINRDSIIFIDSSGLSLDYSIAIERDTSRKVIFKYGKINSPGSYSLTFLPNAFTDLYTQSNTDSLNISFSFLKAEDCGIIQLDFSPLMIDTSNYIIEFRNKGSVINRLESDQLLDSIVIFQYLQPGTYNIRLVQDRNHNGKQDAGNYLLNAKQEAEKEITLQAIKADWQLEEVISWDEKKKDLKNPPSLEKEVLPESSSEEKR